VAGCCEHGNKTLGSIKGSKFFDWLSDYHLLKKDPVLWILILLLISFKSALLVSHFASRSFLCTAIVF